MRRQSQTKKERQRKKEREKKERKGRGWARNPNTRKPESTMVGEITQRKRNTRGT